MRDEANELLRSTGKNGEKRNVSDPFGLDVNRFRNAERGFIKALLLIPASLVLALIAFVAHHEWLKASLDAQIREMCEKDGGIKVYETVTLPAERFDSFGNIGVRNIHNANPNDEYYFKSNDIHLRFGNPALFRSVTQIIRRSDEKVLGESIRYGRGGGDIPGPWHPSTFDCPSIKNLRLEASIFMAGEKK